MKQLGIQSDVKNLKNFKKVLQSRSQERMDGEFIQEHPEDDNSLERKKKRRKAK